MENSLRLFLEINKSTKDSSVNQMATITGDFENVAYLVDVAVSGCRWELMRSPYDEDLQDMLDFLLNLRDDLSRNR